MKRPMRFRDLSLIAVFVLAAEAAGSGALAVSGRIIDRDTREPLPAYVLEETSGRGVSADGGGRFRLILDLPPETDRVHLTVWLIGYRKAAVVVRPGEDPTIALERDVMDAHEITVTADSGVSEKKNQRTVSLTKMEIYTTPGTAADPLYAGQVLPGVNAVPDSSSLLIRGGAPDEVGYYFDGLEVRHPFLSESLHESYFSIFDNQVIDRFNVSTSGFAPKYNDALSGLMDITVKDSVPEAMGGVGLSVLGLGGQIGLPIRNAGGLILSANRSDSRLLNRMNRRTGGDFTNEQTFGKFVWNLHPAHRIRLYGLHNAYRYALPGALGVSSRNGIAGISWTYTPSSRLVLKTLVNANLYAAAIDAGSDSRIRIEDRNGQARIDAAWDRGSHVFEFGLDAQDRFRETSLTDATHRVFNVRGGRFSVYVQDQFRLSDRLFLTVGANALALSLLGGRPYLSPRVSAAFLPTPKDTIRVSAGVYRQSGDDFTMRQYPDLVPKTAFHASFSYDRIGETAEFRATLYDKEYLRLHLVEADGTVSARGHGFARGAEAFLKITRPGYAVLAVVNFLSSKRMENETPVLADSPYAIAHSATFVGTWKFKSGSVGLRYSFAAGRPYTPLAGVQTDESGEEIRPIWGAPYSARYPAFRRLDLNGSVQFHLARRLIVVYYGITNVLDHVNILRYDYAGDYSSRIDQPSLFGRTLFFGVYIPFF